MNAKFIIALQRHVANISIGASTVRGRPKRTAHNARCYLAKLDLSSLHGLNEGQFVDWMNEKTEDLMSEFPEGAKKEWGLARKCLNIFLRNVVYNRYIYNKFKLRSIESWLEVPLDSYTAKALWEHGGKTVPRWKTIKGLDQSTSERYQKAAAEIGARKKMSRVHLDVLYWRQEQNKKNK